MNKIGVMILEIKVWTNSQFSVVQQMESEGRIPADVTNETKRVLSILDGYYGEDRDVENDDGGYVVIFTECVENDEHVPKILEKYHVRLNDEEFKDDLCACDGVIWTSALYLVSNDYGITVIYPREDGSK